MKTFIKSTFLSFATLAVAIAGLTADAQAQRTRTAQQYYVPPVTQPQPQNEFYFGFSVRLVNRYDGRLLRIVSVTPGSPAQQAGLEVGDEIRTVNGQGFGFARDSFDAVGMLNRLVSPTPGGGGPIPATAAAAAGRVGTQYYVSPVVQPIAHMIVRNVRNGQDVAVTVRPTPRAVGVPAAAARAR